MGRRGIIEITSQITLFNFKYLYQKLKKHLHKTISADIATKHFPSEEVKRSDEKKSRTDIKEDKSSKSREKKKKKKKKDRKEKKEKKRKKDKS